MRSRPTTALSDRLLSAFGLIDKAETTAQPITFWAFSDSPIASKNKCKDSMRSQLTAAITQSPPKNYDSNSRPTGDLCASLCYASVSLIGVSLVCVYHLGFSREKSRVLNQFNQALPLQGIFSSGKFLI